MIRIFLLVLFVLTSTFGEEEPRINCPEPNIWMGSDQFDYIPYVASWEDCGRICADTFNCKYWSWGTTSNNFCYLYESSADLNITPGFISGEKGCPEDQEYKDDI